MLKIYWAKLCLPAKYGLPEIRYLNLSCICFNFNSFDLLECNFCQKTGHKAADCWHNRPAAAATKEDAANVAAKKAERAKKAAEAALALAEKLQAEAAKLEAEANAASAVSAGSSSTTSTTTTTTTN